MTTEGQSIVTVSRKDFGMVRKSGARATYCVAAPASTRNATQRRPWRQFFNFGNISRVPANLQRKRSSLAASAPAFVFPPSQPQGDHCEAKDSFARDVRARSSSNSKENLLCKAKEKTAAGSARPSPCANIGVGHPTLAPKTERRSTSIGIGGDIRSDAVPAKAPASLR